LALSDHDKDFEIRFGVDSDKNERISLKEMQGWGGGDFSVYGVSEREYNLAVERLTKMLLLSKTPGRIPKTVEKVMYQLLFRFVKGRFDKGRFDKGLLSSYEEFIPDIQNGTKPGISVRSGFTQPFGFDPSRVYYQEGTPMVDLLQLEYSSASKGAEHIAEHSDVRKKAQKLYNSITFQEIANQYVVDGQIIKLGGKSLGNVDFGFVSEGLGNVSVAGECWFSVKRISASEFEISNFGINMTAGDIWDFNYFNWFVASFVVNGEVIVSGPYMASVVQCGHGLQGRMPGEVIFLKSNVVRPFAFSARRVLK